MWKYKKRNKINYLKVHTIRYRKPIRFPRDDKYESLKDKMTFKNLTFLEKIKRYIDNIMK